MTEKMTDNEAQDVATRLIAAGVEDDIKIQYWLSLVLATVAVVIAPIVTIGSIYHNFFAFEMDYMTYEDFGQAMAFTWIPTLFVAFIHWRISVVMKRAGMKMRF
jgi:hypothetical protein